MMGDGRYYPVVGTVLEDGGSRSLYDGTPAVFVRSVCAGDFRSVARSRFRSLCAGMVWWIVAFDEWSPI